jgi:hypothetical protein
MDPSYFRCACHEALFFLRSFYAHVRGVDEPRRSGRCRTARPRPPTGSPGGPAPPPLASQPLPVRRRTSASVQVSDGADEARLDRGRAMGSACASPGCHPAPVMRARTPRSSSRPWTRMALAGLIPLGLQPRRAGAGHNGPAPDGRRQPPCSPTRPQARRPPAPHRAKAGPATADARRHERADVRQQGTRAVAARALSRSEARKPGRGDEGGASDATSSPTSRSECRPRAGAAWPGAGGPTPCTTNSKPQTGRSFG